ncbi:Ktr system potassium uptake protein A [bioreactor metagenome]|jgi:trk system potassium uptake protein TrkA|uniref:Trk system potassium uptake protein TrkA n=2 Tax=root TaxID=1 RepID=A0A562J0Z9_9FIRM|nr:MULTISPECIES: TrkA family potassium uptake protein [Sedimentibacter]MEA5096655.1 TrkA family potassium uptake protein [Sedimentibacter saalensis]TWH76949.1 trk system potassium uptake protein TrkA [Sedimentibacter saalensis]
MKQIIVVGCGRFGSSVAKTLSKLGHDVMVVDQNPDIIKDISEYVAHAVQMDALDEPSFRTMGIRNFDVAVIAIGSDLEASIMATLIAKEAGVPTVIAKAMSEIHGKLLMKIGADKVIYPERDMGMRVAFGLVTPNILDVIEFSQDYSIIETVALEEWEQKSLKELNLSDMTIIAIKTGERINIVPSSDAVIKKDDIVVILGNNDNLKKISEKR